MKILRIIARLNVGGPARHVVWLTKALQDEEFQSVLIAGTVPTGEENMSYFAAENDVLPLYIEEMSRELSLKDIISLFKVYSRIKKENPDIIHTHTAKAGTVGRLSAFMYRWMTPGTFIGRPRNVKVVHTFHGHVFHSYYGNLKTWIFLLIEKMLARFATDRIITISKQQFSEINGIYGVGKAEQFSVIPLGIDLDVFCAGNGDALRSEIEAAGDDLVVGFVGRLTEIKDLPFLLQTIEVYKERNETDVPNLKFVIAGDGHMRAELEAMTDQLGIRDVLTFLGNRTDMADVYAGLDIVALTSLNEGTPLSLIEGMASGKAVISTGVGGVVDLLGDVKEEHGGFTVCERGIRIDGGNTEAYLRGLIYLAKNEKLRQECAASGKSFVEAEYSTKRLVDDIKELYRELIKH